MAEGGVEHRHAGQMLDQPGTGRASRYASAGGHAACSRAGITSPAGPCTV
jgi:hypothetical protein